MTRLFEFWLRVQRGGRSGSVASGRVSVSEAGRSRGDTVTEILA